LRRWTNYRHQYWVRALIVGVLLAGEVHLYTAEIFHHHSEVVRLCQSSHGGGQYLHPAPDTGQLCPLCQIVRSGSVRPAAQVELAKPVRQTSYRIKAGRFTYSFTSRGEVRPRSPPLA
jgi:hypothetical protein